MASPYESAVLNLQLYELRREPVLREARAWFLRDFNPDCLADVIKMVSGERNASFRMVLGYWDMAASLVTSGAIDSQAFLAAHNEIYGTFSKIQPFLADMRQASGEPDFCRHIEAVLRSDPHADATMARRREAIRAAAKS